MEYNKKTIDLLLEKKFINCSSFKSKYKDLHKTFTNNEGVSILRKCNGHCAKNNKGEILDHIYNTPDEYEGFSFLTKEGFYDDGFSDNIQEGVTFEIPGIPGTPSTPGIPGWTTKGSRLGPFWRPVSGMGECCDHYCCSRPWCRRCPKTWSEKYYDDYPDVWNPGTDPIPGLPGLPGVKFNVPSIPDLYNEMKNKIDSDIVEPFTGYQTDFFESIHETLHSFFEDNTKEILAIIVFCLIWLITTTVTENRLIILLVSSFIASLFYICIRDLNGILYTLDKTDHVISEALK
jgi:hypothetical protein